MNGIERIKTTTTNMRRKAEILKTGLTVVMIIYAAIYAAVLLVSAFGDAGNTPAITRVVSVALLALTGIIGGLVLYTIRSAFKSVSEGASPFTGAQANRLLIIGILLVVNVIVEAIASAMGLSMATSAIISELNTEVLSSTVMVRINIPLCFAAFGCFCLSYIFKYGSLLQWMYDETV